MPVVRSNGPLRVQSKEKSEYSATYGIRQLSGISQKPYLASARETVNQGGTADNVYSSLTENSSVKDFLFGGRYGTAYKTMAGARQYYITKIQ